MPSAICQFGSNGSVEKPKWGHCYPQCYPLNQCLFMASHLSWVVLIFPDIYSRALAESRNTSATRLGNLSQRARAALFIYLILPKQQHCCLRHCFHNCLPHTPWSRRTPKFDVLLTAPFSCLVVTLYLSSRFHTEVWQTQYAKCWSLMNIAGKSDTRQSEHLMHILAFL